MNKSRSFLYYTVMVVLTSALSLSIGIALQLPVEQAFLLGFFGIPLGIFVGYFLRVPLFWLIKNRQHPIIGRVMKPLLGAMLGFQLYQSTGWFIVIPLMILVFVLLPDRILKSLLS